MTHHSLHHEHFAPLAQTEHKVFSHLMHGNANSEVYKELQHLREQDARLGRNFHKDLQALNHQLQEQLVKHHLPPLTIEEHGKDFVIKPQDNAQQNDRSLDSNRFQQLPHAVRHAISHAERHHFGRHQGHFVRPSDGSPDDTTPPSDRKIDATNASPSKSGFGEALLKRLGLPDTPANMAFLDAWQKAEGGSADNPFNTTQNAPGARTFNGIGVKRYPSVEVGVEATAKTLKNGYYNEILSAMKRGDNAHVTAIAVSHTPWGTGRGVARIV
jgi:hypothetical protein